MSGRVAYYGGIVTNELVLYLDSSKKDSYIREGSTWYDISNEKHIATLNGNPIFSNTDFDFTLNGSGDYITIPQNLGDFSREYCCYEIWCYPTLFPSAGQLIFMDRAVFNGTSGVELFVTNASGIIGVRGSGTVRVDSTLTLNLNQWNHIIFNLSGSTAECYINNTYEFLGTINSVVSTTYPLYIGRYPTIPNTYDWNGKISMVRIYSRCLNSNEVLQNYNATKTRFGL